MLRQILESNIRHVLSFIGGWFAFKGYNLELDQELILGLSSLIASMVLGAIQKTDKPTKFNK